MKNQSKKIISFVFNDFTRDIRVYKENKSLLDNNFKILVVATDGKNLKTNDTFHNIPIYRIKCNTISIFPINLILYWIKSIWKFRKERYFHCNDLYTLPIGIAIKIFFNKKAKVVYDCHELETDAGIYNNKPFLKIIAKICEKILIKHVDKVITVSDSIANVYQNKYHIPKPELVLNCPNYKTYNNKKLLTAELHIPKNKKILLYQGEFTKHKASGIKLLIKTFSHKNINSNIVLVLLGYGDLFEQMKKETISKNIYFKNAVSPDIYMDYISSADYGIHLLDNSCLNHEYALPNKIFEYCMAKLPIIVSNLKEMKHFVNQNKIGIVLSKEKVSYLLKDIDKILKMKFNPINFQKINKEYCWENQEKKLINLYKKL